MHLRPDAGTESVVDVETPAETIWPAILSLVLLPYESRLLRVACSWCCFCFSFCHPRRGPAVSPQPTNLSSRPKLADLLRKESQHQLPCSSAACNAQPANCRKVSRNSTGLCTTMRRP